jgi:hypothetical protein
VAEAFALHSLRSDTLRMTDPVPKAQANNRAG